MKISKIVLLIVLLIIFGICGIVFSYNKNDNSIQDNNYVKKKHNEKEKCVAFTGGGFNIKFYTDGGIEIPDMHVCIACSPDSYSDLSVPVRDGYNFDGWYYDKEFTKKVEITNTRDFTPVPEYDINKCLIGYKDIEIYAKWSEVQPRMEENIDSNKVTNYSRNNNSNSTYY